MRRAFLSLYTLIVVAVVAVGWGLDRVWQSQVPGEIIQAGEKQLLDVLEYLVQQTPAEQQQEALDKIGRETALEISLHTQTDFASTKLFERIVSGNPVVVDTGDTRLFYRKLKNQDQIISVRQTVTDVPDPLIYNLLLLCFYLAIALVIFLWIWPLARDLSKLEKQTKLLGSEVVPDELRIAPTSAVYDLASAFNRMARRVRDLLASHKEMTYAVSHELRTPLARMKFGLEMANDLQDPARIKQQLSGVREDVTEMDALVNQLFTYAGFENSEQTLDLQPGDMGALIVQLIQRAKANPAHAQLNYEFTNELPDETVICEWYLIERAILNLLHNAQRYAKTTITVTLRQSAGHFQIIVDDDGPGVPASERQRIFQSFIRLTNHTNAQVRGLGLGLAIVSKIMQWHHGRAFAEESPSGGARLVLEWGGEIVEFPQGG